MASRCRQGNRGQAVAAGCDTAPTSVSLMSPATDAALRSSRRAAIYRAFKSAAGRAFWAPHGHASPPQPVQRMENAQAENQERGEEAVRPHRLGRDQTQLGPQTAPADQQIEAGQAPAPRHYDDGKGRRQAGVDLY